jgi:hypothetical protein
MNDPHQEIRDRLALARHAKRQGLKVARAWHVQLALDARAKLRFYPAGCKPATSDLP